MNFDRELLTNNKLFVYCRTEEEAKILCEWAHKNGKTWHSGKSFNKKTHFKKYDEIAYNIADGTYGSVKIIKSKYDKFTLKNFNEVKKNQLKEIIKKVKIGRNI